VFASVCMCLRRCMHGIGFMVVHVIYSRLQQLEGAVRLASVEVLSKIISI
jgi:hypothetical protein